MQNVDDLPRYQQSPQISSRFSTDEYEFTSEQDSLFSGLASAMSFVGTASVVLGLFTFLGVLNGEPLKIIGAIVQGVLSVIVGIWLRGASKSIKAIATTEGSDISNLMTAMAELKKVYSLQRVLILVALGILAIAFCLGLTGALGK
jgi:hypothetical protein